MGVETQKFVRKPLYVQAVRVTEQNFEELADWCQGDIETEGNKKFIRVRVHHPKFPKQTQAFIGDWLLWHESGYKIYTDRAFRASFDVAEKEHIETPPSGPDTAVDVEEPAEVEQPPVAAAPTPVVPGEAEEESRLQEETGPAEKLRHEPQHTVPEEHEGKRVLTLQEQHKMSADDVRDLVTAGEVVLEQDIAA